MTDQKYIPGIVAGYKATDADMCCRGFQFELGVWYECEPGEIIRCGSNGFHFCKYPSGPWSYYYKPGTRLFEIEAEYVLDEPATPGADYKLVCRRIRLTKEIAVTGDRNTGDYNTGDRNTGDYNTGDRNTGDCNTGYANTGHGNTGNRNTGHSNTGDHNTGEHNTGDRNTGHRNTGDSNTGDHNTGDSNTGYLGTGVKFATCFDLPTEYTHEEFTRIHSHGVQDAWEYVTDIREDVSERVKALPNYTQERLDNLRAQYQLTKAGA